MAGDTLRVIFEGTIRDGMQPEDVKRRLAKVFRMDESKSSLLFQGKSVTVKKGVDEATAEKYVAAFNKAGAVCRIESEPSLGLIAEDLTRIAEDQIRAEARFKADEAVPTRIATGEHGTGTGNQDIGRDEAQPRSADGEGDLIKEEEQGSDRLKHWTAMDWLNGRLTTRNTSTTKTEKGKLFWFSLLAFSLAFLAFGLYTVIWPHGTLFPSAYNTIDQAATEIGNKPPNSPWDGSVQCVKDYLWKTLHDADSIKHSEWSKVSLRETNGHKYWVVRVRYTAKNASGTHIVRDQLAFIQNDQVVFMEDHD